MSSFSRFLVLYSSILSLPSLPSVGVVVLTLLPFVPRVLATSLLLVVRVGARQGASRP